MTIILVGFLSALWAGVFCEAGIRAPGKYCGVVIFDRWDGCTLYSGIYVMYISEAVKEGLREHAHQAVQIDAKEVDQPINPGDGRIGEFQYLGPAPRTQNWVQLDGISLVSAVRAGDDGKPVATITIQNNGTEAVKLFSGELALTLLTKRGPANAWDVPDGPSYAVITRENFEIGASEPRWHGSGFVTGGEPYSWTIGQESALPHDFLLAAGETREIQVRLELPDGEYDFLSGYGGGTHGGKCLASNLFAFDVENGVAKVVAIEGR